MSATPPPSCAPPTTCSRLPLSAFAARRCRRLLRWRASRWRPRTGDEAAGTRIEIAGGKILHVDDAALPRGTTIAVADLFFNTPARRKFLRAESTELAHVTALVTHYALVHPEKHFELLSATHTIVSAPPVTRTAERIYQIFGKDTLGQLLPVAAETPLERAGLPEPPPWKKDPDEPTRDPGIAAPHRLLLQARAAKAQSQFDLHLRQQAPHPRPAADARHHRGLSQRDSAHQLSGGAAVSGDAAGRGGRQRASGQDRGALSPAEPRSRLCPRQPAHGADQGAAGGRIPGRARFAAHGQPVADAAGHLAPAGRAGFRRCPDSDPDGLPDCADGCRALPADPAAASPVPGSLPFGAGSLRPGEFDQKAWGEAAAALFQPATGASAENCSPESDGFGQMAEMPRLRRPWWRPSRLPPT